MLTTGSKSPPPPYFTSELQERKTIDESRTTPINKNFFMVKNN
jgi:hypothetical protein